MPDQLNDVHLSVTLYGLGVVWVETHVRNVGVRARQRIYVTPIDAETVDIRAVVHVRETDDPVFTGELAQLFYSAYVEDFAKDFPIWENKRYLPKPQLAKGDGPIGAYRKWCTQFYAAVAPTETRGEPVAVAVPMRERIFDLARRVRERLTPAASATERTSEPALAKATRPVQSATDYFDSLPERFTSSASS